MKKLLALCAAFAAAAAFAADPVPLFNATLTVGKDHRFVLVTAAGKSSPFLRLGETFDGFTLRAYDVKSGELTLERDGRKTVVTLVAEGASAGGAAAAPAAAATVTDAKAVLDAMNFESMMDKTLAGMRKGQMAMVERMMTQVGGGGPEKDEVIAFQKKLVNEVMSALSGAEMKEDVAKIYAEVFTKDELQALAGFYSSPLGQSFSDKQAVLAEKMNAVMMPRIVNMMPKVQGMVRDFGQEMKAKREAAAAAKAPTGNP